MTPEQKVLVQTSFAKVVKLPTLPASLFYTRLFEMDPGLRVMFKGDMTEQGRKLMKALTLTVSSLDRLAELTPIIQMMGARHATYGVQDYHYDTVAGALLWTLEQGLGAEFTVEVRMAWVKVYTCLAAIMQEAARNQHLSATTPLLTA